MLTPPELEDPRQYDYEYGDQEEMIYKKNALNAYHYNFYNALKVIVGELNVEFQFVADSRLDITNKSGQVATALQQVNTAKQSVDQSKNHIDQQKQAIDSTAGQVSQNAQQVASDKQVVAQDKQAAAASAQAAGSSASDALTAKQQAEALYGDLDAVNTAKTQSQQAATTASQQRQLAQTARQGAETAQQAAETAAQEANVDVDAAIAALVDSSPDALNTLNELAAALGGDPNFSTTMLNALAEKANATGTYSSLRARGTTKGDVGLSNIPNGITASRGLDSDDHLLTARGMNAHRTSGDHDDRYFTKAQGDSRYWKTGETGYAPDKDLNDFQPGEGGYARSTLANYPPQLSSSGAHIVTLGGFSNNDRLQISLPQRNHDIMVMRIMENGVWGGWFEFLNTRNSEKFDSGATYLNLRAQRTTKGDVGLPDVPNIDFRNGLEAGNSTVHGAISHDSGYMYIGAYGGSTHGTGSTRLYYSTPTNELRLDYVNLGYIENISIRGVFSGDGSGLTNLDVSAAEATTGSNSRGRYYLYPDGRLVMQCGIKTFTQDPSSYRYLLCKVTLPYTPLGSAEHYVTATPSSDASDYSSGASPLDVAPPLAKPGRVSSGTVVEVRVANISKSNHSSGATAKASILVESRWK